MSWADIKRKYERQGTATQSTEDIVARRVLRACGLTEKALWRAERDAGTENERREDSTLLERTVRLVQAASSGSQTAFFPPPVVRDVKSFKEAEDTLLELIDGLDRTVRAPVLVYRVKGGKDVRALQSKGCADMITVSELPLPCRIMKSRDGQETLVDCDAGTYFDTLLGRKGHE